MVVHTKLAWPGLQAGNLHRACTLFTVDMSVHYNDTINFDKVIDKALTDGNFVATKTRMKFSSSNIDHAHEE